MLTDRHRLFAALAGALALAACAASSTSTTTSDLTPSATASAPAPAAAGLSAAQRDLTPDEKKLVINALSSSLTNPGSAKYHWTKFPTVPETDQPVYCATVDGNSPHAAYNGRQTYIVDTKVTGGHITAAVLGLIAGGKDAAIVVNMCATHGLDPNKAT